MIEISNLSKSFDNKNYVLENLNCKIKDNAIYGLVGANESFFICNFCRGK